MFSRNLSLVATFLTLIIFSAICFAQVVVPGAIPDSFDWGKIISAVLTNPKSLNAMTIGFIVIIGAVQFLKTDKLKNIFKNLNPKLQGLLIILLGQIYVLGYEFFIQKIPVNTVILGFITSGGAVLVFDQIKKFLAKS